MNPAHAIGQSVLISALRFRPKVGFLDWAPENIRNDDGTAFRFRPYQQMPAARIFDPRVGRTSLSMYSGAGKTYLFVAAYGYAIKELKLDCATCFPARDQASDWLRKKLKPVLDASGALSGVRVLRSVATAMAFENGASIEVAGLNSGGGLRALELNWVNTEEIDAVQQDASDEGNKLLIAFRRTRGRKVQIHTQSSYPGEKGRSNIDAALAVSDGCEWHYECPRCGKPQYFHRDHIRWTAGKPETAEVECPGCSKLFGDSDRAASSDETGRWVDRDGDIVTPDSAPKLRYNHNCGFHLNCMAHPAGASHKASYANWLHQIAAETAEASRAPDRDKAMRTIVNTLDSESYQSEVADKPGVPEVLAARQSYNPSSMLPEGAAIVLGFADVNKRFIAALTMAFGVDWDADGEAYGGRWWGLRYEIISGNATSPQTYAKLDKFRQIEYAHPSGAILRPKWFGVDAGHQTETVKRYTRARQRYGVRAVLGERSMGKEAFSRKKVEKDGTIVLWAGTDALKAELFGRYENSPEEIDTPQGPVFTDHPEAGFDADFFAGLLESEDGEIVSRGRHTFLHYEKRLGPDVPRNEPLDCVVGCLMMRHTIAAPDTRLHAGLLRRSDPEPNPRQRAGKQWQARPKKWI